MRDFSLRHRIQTGSGAHPASYPMDNGDKVKNAWSYNSTPQYVLI
jgi:hypothetical protein